MTAYKKMGFLMAFILPSLIILGYNLGGFWTFSNFFFAYAFIPLIDEVFGKDPQNIERNDLPALAGEIYFEGVLHVLAYVQLGIVVWACYVFSLGTMSTLEMVGMTLSVMTLSGGAINIAHELGHKPSKIAQFHSKMILMTVCYMHFFIEHNKGHHVHVATPNDPATSKKGQSFYQFWAQSVFGSWLSAWNIEKKRLSRVGKSIISFDNEMIWFMLAPLFFCGLLTAFFSFQIGVFVWIVPVFFFTQAVLAFSTLEAVNYIEHYGLMRKEISPNRYERVNPLHSWNSNHMVSNFLLFQLQRHSDHHAYATRPYQILRHFDESPQLPAGYPLMILTALVPPIWFRVMNKRLEIWKEKSYDANYISKVVKSFA